MQNDVHIFCQAVTICCGDGEQRVPADGHKSIRQHYYLCFYICIHRLTESKKVELSPSAAETAYKECLAMDKKEELLRAAASSGSANLEAALAAYSPAVPAMPPTEAVLRTLPAQGDFPGAQFRLAGDR